MARELTNLTTEELLTLAARPAREAEFAEAVTVLVFRYKALVYKVALWRCRGNVSLAEDVFQNTFLRLFTWLKRRRGKPPMHSFARLIYVFAERAAIDLMRSERVQGESSDEEQEQESENSGKHLEEGFYVSELLELLEPRSREVIRLTYFQGLSATEIAESMGLTPGNVRLLRFRALEALRAMKRRDCEADVEEEV
jgi:RNA polymerase sigma-70 factor (ECF subfamily)